MPKKYFPSFLNDKKRVVGSTDDVGVEIESQTDQTIEEETVLPKKHIIIFYSVALVVFLILFFKLFALQVVLGEINKQKAEGNRLRIRESLAPRGIIYDHKKNPLVQNIASFSIEVYPDDLPTNKEDRNNFYQNISNILQIPLSEIEKIEDKRNTQEPIVIKENLTQDEAILIESKILNLSAVKVIKNPQREYLEEKYNLSFILGYPGKVTKEDLQNNSDYSSIDIIGKNGLESSYEKYLKGENAKQKLEVDSLGKVARILDSTPTKSGNSLILSLDLGLQEKMVQSLSSMIEKSKSKGGVIVAANPKTGAILGMVSLPSYNNNLFSRGIKQEEYDKLLNDKAKPMFNRAISGQYPPGSVVKPVVATAGLEEKIISASTTISDPGIITITNPYNPSIVYSYPDWKPGGHGRVDVEKAIEQSCDIFFYSVGGGWQNIKGLGAAKLAEWYEKLGLGKKTGIDIPGETEGFVPTADWKEKTKKEIWYQGDTYHISIGQGDLLATPLQLLNYTMYFANGGTIYSPHFVEEIQSPEGSLLEKIEPKKIAENLASPSNISIVREGMKRVITQGTARSLSDLPFSLAGKTGTAQNPHGEPHAWFISFAPFDDPQIALVVFLENGGEGSSTASPIAKEILKYWYENVKS